MSAELSRHATSLLSPFVIDDQCDALQAAAALLDCYQKLATTGRHLLAPLLHDATPKQWQHYPIDDVIDTSSGFQYFYHSHSPEDRPEAGEHGHFHLFARLDNAALAIDPVREQRFLEALASAPACGNVASLLCIGLDAKGVPTSLFTVNRWVTGGHLLSADATMDLLTTFHVDTPGLAPLNQWLSAMLGLFRPQLLDLLQQRDQHLQAWAERTRDGVDLLDDESLEVLSATAIDVDQQLAQLA